MNPLCGEWLSRVSTEIDLSICGSEKSAINLVEHDTSLRCASHLHATRAFLWLAESWMDLGSWVLLRVLISRRMRTRSTGF